MSRWNPLWSRPNRAWTIVGLTLILGGTALGVWAFRATRSGPVEELTQSLASPVDQLSVLAAHPKGRFLAAGSATGRTVVWNDFSAAGEPLQRLTDRPMTTLAVSRDGLLMAGTADRRLLGWQITGRQGQTVSQSLPDFPAAVTCLAVHPNRFTIAVGLSNGALYQMGPQGVISRQTEHSRGLKAVAYHHNGRLLVTAGVQGRLIWWNTGNQRETAVKQPHSTEVAELAFSGDGRYLASADWNGRIIIWRVETRRQQTTLQQPDAVSGLTWQDGHLITGSWDGRLRLWSMHPASSRQEIETGQPIYDLTPCPGTEQIATVSLRNRVRLWRIEP